MTQIHIPEPSPWPLVLTLIACLLAPAACTAGLLAAHRDLVGSTESVQ